MVFGSHDQRKTKIELTIKGEKIERVQEFKYLGYWIREDLLNSTNLERRKTNALKKSFNLNKVGFNNRNLHPFIKSYYIKSHCRPVLTYGIENTSFSLKDLKEISKLENNIIRRCLNVPLHSKMNLIRKALKLESTEQHIIRKKLAFLLNYWQTI
jgi:hypothetical protein